MSIHPARTARRARPSSEQLAPADPRRPAGAVLSVVRWAAISAAFVNLGIHTALTPMHLAEKRYIGVLFVVGSASLCAVIAGLASDRDRLRAASWLVGSAVCATEVILFVLSRTIGLPGGYLEGWARQTEDMLGLVCLLVEVVFIAGAAVSVTRQPCRTNTSTIAQWVRWHDRTAPLR